MTLPWYSKYSCNHILTEEQMDAQKNCIKLWLKSIEAKETQVRPLYHGVYGFGHREEILKSFTLHIDFDNRDHARLFRNSIGRDYEIEDFVRRDYVGYLPHHFVLSDMPELYQLVDGEWIILAGVRYTRCVIIGCDEAAAVMLKLALSETKEIKRNAVCALLNASANRQEILWWEIKDFSV